MKYGVEVGIVGSLPATYGIFECRLWSETDPCGQASHACPTLMIQVRRQSSHRLQNNTVKIVKI